MGELDACMCCHAMQWPSLLCSRMKRMPFCYTSWSFLNFHRMRVVYKLCRVTSILAWMPLARMMSGGTYMRGPACIGANRLETPGIYSPGFGASVPCPIRKLTFTSIVAEFHKSLGKYWLSRPKEGHWTTSNAGKRIWAFANEAKH